MVDFETHQQEACYERVRGYLDELFVDRTWASADSPYFVLREGSAVATVAVSPWRGGTVVRAWSVVVTDIRPTPELYEYLLRLNADQEFGAFALDPDNDIILSHTIIGDTLDPGELRATVEAIAKGADDYDDEIVERFGGLRAQDREDLDARA